MTIKSNIAILTCCNIYCILMRFHIPNIYHFITFQHNIYTYFILKLGNKCQCIKQLAICIGRGQSVLYIGCLTLTEETYHSIEIRIKIYAKINTTIFLIIQLYIYTRTCIRLNVSVSAMLFLVKSVLSWLIFHKCWLLWELFVI